MAWRSAHRGRRCRVPVGSPRSRITDAKHHGAGADAFLHAAAGSGAFATDRVARGALAVTAANQGLCQLDASVEGFARAFRMASGDVCANPSSLLVSSVAHGNTRSTLHFGGIRRS